MMNSKRLPGQAGKYIQEDALKFERDSVLMSFDAQEDIPVHELMEQWDVSVNRRSWL
ncbi:hypothetical protein ACFL0D_08990 [Thermoproteota archaeon]